MMRVDCVGNPLIGSFLLSITHHNPCIRGKIGVPGMGAEGLLVDIPITAGTSQSRVEMVVKESAQDGKCSSCSLYS
jgi:hypothetical protein